MNHSPTSPRGSTWLVGGAVISGVAVVAGAFGAHALRGRLDPDLLAVFETAARYQMYHGLALLAVGLAHGRASDAWLARSGWLFLAGILVFCGSLYSLAFTGLRWLGAITPFGGVGFIGGWIALAVAAGSRARPATSRDER